MYLLTANVVRKAPKKIVGKKKIECSCYLQFRLFLPTLEKAEKERQSLSHNPNFFNISIRKI